MRWTWIYLNPGEDAQQRYHSDRMKPALSTLTILIFASSVILAQHEHGGSSGGPSGGGGFHGPPGGGYIPSHGPSQAPHQNAPQQQGQRANFRDQPGHPNAPHVDDHENWVGHEGGNTRYHLDYPWAHGHFGGAIGPSHIYRLGGGGPSRFFFNGFYFGVAPYDLGFAGGWLWNSDDIVLYDDPDDVGWYLAYNPRLGTYVHVQYLG